MAETLHLLDESKGVIYSINDVFVAQTNTNEIFWLMFLSNMIRVISRSMLPIICITASMSMSHGGGGSESALNMVSKEGLA